jgi:hypothetical protein
MWGVSPPASMNFACGEREGTLSSRALSLPNMIHLLYAPCAQGENTRARVPGYSGGVSGMVGEADHARHPTQKGCEGMVCSPLALPPLGDPCRVGEFEGRKPLKLPPLNGYEKPVVVACPKVLQYYETAYDA